MRILVVFLLGAAVGFGVHLLVPPDPPVVLTAVPVHVPVALPFPLPAPVAVFIPVPALRRRAVHARPSTFSAYVIDRR